MSVRPLAESDLSQVTDLYWRYMRQKDGAAPPTLLTTFKELYFSNPFVDHSAPPLVYEGKDGKIVGFLGILIRKMSLNGQTLRVALGGNLVVHPDARSQLAAPRLLGTYMSGKHDMWMTDSANDLSRKLIERLGFRVIPAMNIHWVRPLRPAHYAVHALSRATESSAMAALKLASKPFCALADGLAAKVSFSPFYQPKPKLHGADLDAETLFQCLTESRKEYAVGPEYDAVWLRWLLHFMESRPARGKLRKIVVRDSKNQIVGWYIYFVKKGAIGEVVQVGGQRKATGDILDHLFYDAWEQGVIGLHGVVQSRQMPDFSDNGCLFTCRGGWTMAYSKNTELISRLERGDVFFSRLDGEWCLDPGA